MMRKPLGDRKAALPEARARKVRKRMRRVSFVHTLDLIYLCKKVLVCMCREYARSVRVFM